MKFHRDLLVLSYGFGGLFILVLDIIPEYSIYRSTNILYIYIELKKVRYFDSDNDNTITITTRYNDKRLNASQGYRGHGSKHHNTAWNTKLDSRLTSRNFRSLFCFFQIYQ